MRRATITLDDELEEAVDRYLASLEAPPSLASLVQAALRRYLERVEGKGPRRRAPTGEVAEARSGYDGESGGVELDPETALMLRRAAAEEGVATAELARSVLRDYVRDRGRPRPVGTGEYHSGRSDVGSRAEELLRRAVRSSR